MTKSHTIKAKADLRPLCSPVRDQGARPTCLACATSDAHSIEQSCPPLSAEFLFFHAIRLAKIGNLQDGILFEEAAAALEKSGQPVEAEWPYTLVQASPWVAPAVTALWRGVLSHDVADAALKIAHLLQANRPVVLGLKISPKFLKPRMPAATIDGDGPGYGGHAVMAVGLGLGPVARSRILIRNSWGKAWGDSGYAWLSPSYLSDKLIGYASVTPKAKV